MTVRFMRLWTPLLMVSCSSQEPISPPPSPRPVPVEVAAATPGQLTDKLVLSAEIEPLRHTALASGSGGKVDAVLVDRGDTVRAGQLLVRVSAGLADAELKRAEAARASAQATFRRTQKLAAQDLASAASMESATLALAEAEAAVAMARVRYADALIRAPHAGVVAKRHVDPGEYAVPGGPLLDLVNTQKVKIIAQIPERDAPLIQQRTQGSIAVDALDQVFEAELTQVGVVAAPFSRTFDVEFVIDNPNGTLRPGMLARVTLVRRKLENVVTVRRDAVFDDLLGPAVFLARNGTAQRQTVRLGPAEGNRVAVLEGLRPGDLVVVVGQRSLVNGQPIRSLSPEDAETLAGAPGAADERTR